MHSGWTDIKPRRPTRRRLPVSAPERPGILLLPGQPGE